MIISKNDITIRDLENTEKDFDLLLKWLSNEKVTEYSWNENLPWTINKVREDFKASENDGVSKNFILYKGKEIGFIQYYPIEKDSYKFESDETYEIFKGAYGFDMFIGIPEFWGRGIGKSTLDLLCGFLYKEKGVRKFSADPSLDNKNGLIFWQKAGFKPVLEAEDFDDSQKKSLLMLRIME